MVQSKILVELSGVLITVIESDMFSIDDNILADDEVLNTNIFAGPIRSEALPSPEDFTLWDSGVGLFWLEHGERIVFEIVEDDQFSESFGFES